MTKLSKVVQKHNRDLLEMIASLEATLIAIHLVLGQIKDKLPEPKKPKKK